MTRTNLGAVRRLLLVSAVLTLSPLAASAQIVERSQTWANLIATHPCNAGLNGRHTILTDAQSSSSIGGGAGAGVGGRGGFGRGGFTMPPRTRRHSSGGATTPRACRSGRASRGRSAPSRHRGGSTGRNPHSAGVAADREGRGSGVSGRASQSLTAADVECRAG